MYKDKLLQDINKVIQNFFIEEQGNRVTTNNIQGLSLKIKRVIDSNKYDSKEGKE